MQQRTVILVCTAATLIGAALWLNLGGTHGAYQVQPLNATEVAELPANLDSDLRLIEVLRSRCGREPGDWKNLPGAAKTAYVTLWAEEVHRTMSWSQLAASEMVDGEYPTFSDIASAYDDMNCPETAAGVRAMASPFTQVVTSYQAWFENARNNKAGPPPPTKALDVASRDAFAHLDSVRPRRLDYIRAHVQDLGVR